MAASALGVTSPARLEEDSLASFAVRWWQLQLYAASALGVTSPARSWFVDSLGVLCSQVEWQQRQRRAELTAGPGGFVPRMRGARTGRTTLLLMARLSVGLSGGGRRLVQAGPTTCPPWREESDFEFGLVAGFSLRVS